MTKTTISMLLFCAAVFMTLPARGFDFPSKNKPIEGLGRGLENGAVTQQDQAVGAKCGGWLPPCPKPGVSPKGGGGASDQTLPSDDPDGDDNSAPDDGSDDDSGPDDGADDDSVADDGAPSMGDGGGDMSKAKRAGEHRKPSVHHRQKRNIQTTKEQQRRSE